jgi:hypothetical protein
MERAAGDDSGACGFYVFSVGVPELIRTVGRESALTTPAMRRTDTCAASGNLEAGEMSAETAAMEFLAERGWRGGVERGTEARRLRDEFRSRFSFAILDMKTVQRITRYGPLIEIGSGRGYWAFELRKAGVDIIATDSMVKGRYWRSGDWRESWTPIEQMDAVEAARAHPARTLLTVWPDEGRSWPALALRAYPGGTVLYVGEAPGGRTGNYKFHTVLHDEFVMTDAFPIPHFHRQQDLLWVWERRAAATSRSPAASGSMA